MLATIPDLINRKCQINVKFNLTLFIVFPLILITIDKIEIQVSLFATIQLQFLIAMPLSI